MPHVGDMELVSDMWERFETLYRDSRFIERNTIFMRLSTQTLSDFHEVSQFTDTIKRNSIRVREIDTTDVPDVLYTTWPLRGLSSEYDSFRMMLTNNRKAAQAKGDKDAKHVPDFDSILEQILSLDTQKKSSESRSMKSSSKPNEAKKSTGTTQDAYPYCNKGGHSEDNYKQSHGTGGGFFVHEVCRRFRAGSCCSYIYIYIYIRGIATTNRCLAYRQRGTLSASGQPRTQQADCFH